MISNGVINLSPDKATVFADAARVLRPGGRLAIADIVTAHPAPRGRHLRRRALGRLHRRRDAARRLPQAIEAAGFTFESVRENEQYRFVSERADNATQKYGVKSISLLARRA